VSISQLCSRGILLKKGLNVSDNSVKRTIVDYLKDISENSARSIVLKSQSNDVIDFLEASVFSQGKSITQKIDISDEIIIKIVYLIKQNVKGVNIGINIKKEGILLSRVFDTDCYQSLLDYRQKGEYISLLSFPKEILALGQYSIDLAVGFLGKSLIQEFKDCLYFEIENINSDLSMSSFSRNRDCMVNIPVTINTSLIN
jgi:lipopolysaccharide transport system ATP-binding protein